MSSSASSVLLPVVVALSLVACGGPPGDPDLTCGASPRSVTLAADLQAQVFADCAVCHGAGYSYGDYSSAATTAEVVGRTSLYAGTAGTLKVVAAGNLANSALWLKVLGGTARGRIGPRGENVFGAMPNDGTALTSEQLQLVKDWICSGAK